jgi:hypothetical protein
LFADTLAVAADAVVAVAAAGVLVGLPADVA